MKRSEMPFMPEYFDRYILLVEDIDIVTALEKHAEFSDEDIKKFRLLGDSVYAPGKWTIKDTLQHLVDTERIMGYRALTFARKDATALPGFEENDYAANSNASGRTLDDLLDEYTALRRSTIRLFKSFTDEAQQRVGTSNNKKLSVLSLGFVIAGHPLHHMNVVMERYYPLLDQ